MHLLHFLTHAAIELIAESVVLVPSKGMEKVVLADPEQGGEFFIICGHELCLGWRSIWVGLSAGMRDLQDVVNVFHCAETLSVEVQHRSSF